MRWASKLATEPDDSAAIEAALAGLVRDLDGAPADLVFAFATPHFEAQLSTLFARVQAAMPGARLIGCTGGGVVGGAQEVERSPALALIAASLPGVLVEPFSLTQASLPVGVAREPWRALLSWEPERRRHCVLLADPFSVDAAHVVEGLDGVTATLVGGLASGGEQPGEHRLLLDDAVLSAGAVGVALSGNVVVDPFVAQGCRPIGAPLFVTRVEGNVLYALDGQTAMEALQGVLDGLDPAERALARRTLFVGLVTDPQRQSYAAGDSLVRTVLGLDPRSGALIVGARPAPQSVVQFHVRDAASSAAELEALLRRAGAEGARRPAGALMFSCLGRGRGLYGVPNHDLEALFSEFGPVPVGGFFCNGEIGPVHGRAHLHGYSNAIAFFRSRLDA